MKIDKTEIVVYAQTTDGQPARLIFELGGIPEQEAAKLREEAERLNKSSNEFTFYLDNLKASTSHDALGQLSSNKKAVTVLARGSDASLRRGNQIQSNNYKQFSR